MTDKLWQTFGKILGNSGIILTILAECPISLNEFIFASIPQPILMYTWFMNTFKRELDEFSKDTMKENGQMRAAAPQCKGQLGWVYHKGFCYLFTSYHETFLKAEEECNMVGAYLADVLTEEENNWIKSVLNVINPKDGTDYWLGGLDANIDKSMQWVTGKKVAKK